MAETNINSVESPERAEPELELIDIEQPIEPGVNWLAWIELGFTALVLVVFLWVAIWVGRRLWPRLQLEWQLKKSRKQFVVKKDDKAFTSALFNGLEQAKQKQLLTPEHLLTLKDKINQACFSREDVSRETLLAITDEFLHFLKQNKQSVMTLIKLRLMALKPKNGVQS